MNSLIKECPRTPFQGTGKPEPSSWRPRWLVVPPDQPGNTAWSISATDDGLLIAQCR
ncbi:hypothetical protein ACRAWD_19090 [Caulobacter segnis]